MADTLPPTLMAEAEQPEEEGRRGSCRRLCTRSRRGSRLCRAGAVLGTAAAAASSSEPGFPRGPVLAGEGWTGEEERAGGKGRGAPFGYSGGGGGGGRPHPDGPAHEWTRGFANGLSRSWSGSSSAPTAWAAPRTRLLRGAEVDRGRCGWPGRGSRCQWPLHTGTTGPASSPRFHPTPIFFCQPLPVTRQGLGQGAISRRFGTRVSVRVGANAGHCSIVVFVAGRDRSPVSPSLLPACSSNLSSCCFHELPREVQLEQKRRKG